jgi:hypothetical protein
MGLSAKTIQAKIEKTQLSTNVEIAMEISDLTDTYSLFIILFSEENTNMSVICPTI